MPQGDTVFFPMTDYWMGRLIDGRRVEVRARTAHWARLIPGRRFARCVCLDLLGGFLHPPGSYKSRACGYAAWAKGAQLRITHELHVFTA